MIDRRLFADINDWKTRFARQLERWRQKLKHVETENSIPRIASAQGALVAPGELVMHGPTTVVFLWTGREYRWVSSDIAGVPYCAFVDDPQVLEDDGVLWRVYDQVLMPAKPPSLPKPYCKIRLPQGWQMAMTSLVTPETQELVTRAVQLAHGEIELEPLPEPETAPEASSAAEAPAPSAAPPSAEA